jgi:hypothetical protein
VVDFWTVWDSKASGARKTPCTWVRDQLIRITTRKDLSMEASGTIRKSQFGYGFSEIVIRPTLKITHSTEREHARDLLKKAEKDYASSPVPSTYL